MAAVEPPGETTPPQEPATTAAPPTGTEPKKHHSAWLWVSVMLAFAVAGLLFWGLNKQSDLNDANATNAQLQSENSQQKDSGSAIVAAAKSAYDDLTAQLGATNEDLKQTQDDLDQAQQDADAAKQAAADSKSEVDKANAQADEAKAKATIVADCAKAYLSAFGQLLGGGGIDQVKQDIQGVTADCKGALGGT